MIVVYIQQLHNRHMIENDGVFNADLLKTHQWFNQFRIRFQRMYILKLSFYLGYAWGSR